MCGVESWLFGAFGLLLYYEPPAAHFCGIQETWKRVAEQFTAMFRNALSLTTRTTRKILELLGMSSIAKQEASGRLDRGQCDS